MAVSDSNSEQPQAGGVSSPTASRDAGGKFLPGHSEAAQHYLETDRVPAHYLREEAALLAGSIEDDGGPAEIPSRRMSQHAYRALVHRKIRQLSDALDARGMTDKRGKLRVSWLQRLEALIATAVRLDQSLGLERRTRNVNDLQAFLEGKYAKRD